MLKKLKENKKGFTLVELMVTMVLVGILLGASAAGIFYYQKWSVWQRQEHYARTLFLAAQSGMTQYSTDKHLEEFDKEAQTSAQAIVRQNIRDINVLKRKIDRFIFEKKRYKLISL